MGENAIKYRFADFTHANYRRLVKLMRARFDARTFSEVDRGGEFLLVRHDIDFSVHAALPIARIEAEEGLRATYFALLRCESYNPLERSAGDALRALRALGHEVALHFDAQHHGIAHEDELEDALARERDLLQEVIGAPVRAFSFHNPNELVLTRCERSEYAGLLSTYSAYFKREVAYCSDSNGHWRHRRLEDVLTEEPRPARLQVLTHPEHWTETVMSPHQRIMRTFDAVTERLRATYAAALRASNRQDVDE